MKIERQTLHLEISSKCTLACPACPRTQFRDSIKAVDLPLSAIQRILRSGIQFSDVSLCGDHGDPIYHSQFHEVLRTLVQLPGEPQISVATNGSYRSVEWWVEVAQILRPKDNVIFGIDGLSDTFTQYRKNADWNSIMKGIQTLKTHGRCQVFWQWILFSFNEHQLEQAALIARTLGIDRFMLIGSPRHDETDSWAPRLSLGQAEAQFKTAYNLSTLQSGPTTSLHLS